MRVISEVKGYFVFIKIIFNLTNTIIIIWVQFLYVIISEVKRYFEIGLSGKLVCNQNIFY